MKMTNGWKRCAWGVSDMRKDTVCPHVSKCGKGIQLESVGFKLGKALRAGALQLRV